MYKFDRDHQFKLSDFNQPIGLHMNPENRWVVKAAQIPWKEIELKYAKLFPGKKGMPAKPLRTALGSHIIQKQYGYSDRELVMQIRENPYYQFFIGLPGYQDADPFAPSLLVEFRKRLTEEILCDINEMIIAFNTPDDDPPGGGGGSDDGDEAPADNQGTLILDATCAPQNIEFPQDINLLNEAREILETTIDDICETFGYYKPRMYRENARKDYLNIAKCKKRTAKKLHKAIKKQLQYVNRDLRYLDDLLSQDDVEPTKRQAEKLAVIRELIAQQQYMYDNHTHSVKDRIVSISQPYIRPIVRGKAKAPTEFGAKLDMSIDERGLARLEKLSFDSYNESDVLISALERYRDRTGHYPARVLVDQIYRNRKNLAYCRQRGIRVSGPALGRPKPMSPEEKRQAYIDNTDRIEVERGFSLGKRCYGLGLIRTKLDTTTRSSIALSILTMNIDRLVAIHLRSVMITVFSRIKWQVFLLKNLLSGNEAYLAIC